MKIDFETMSAEEIKAIIDNAQNALVEAELIRINEAKERIMKIAGENGLTVYFTNVEMASKVKPKYQNDKGNTWAGRGKMPNWLSNAIASGAKIEDFLINK